ncbi:MAG: dihydroorotate dehydrogenase-like protein, partial [Microthrixaceae bacterium]
MSDNSRLDETTTYLGLELATPLVASASPLTRDLDSMRDLEANGVGAVVLPSLYEEEVEQDARTLQMLLHQGAEAFVEAATYIPEVDEYRTGPTPYLRHLEAAVDALSIPVLGSLNGTTPGGWTEYAAMMADSGAAAIELNPYQVAADAALTPAGHEQRVLELTEQVVASVEVPVSVKLSPWWSALANLATRLVEAGSAGLVLFNRFVQPDIDLDTLTVVDHVKLSAQSEILLPMRWTALLRDQLPCSLALSGGVYDGDDAAKALLAGADAVMTTSALLRHGPGRAATIRRGLVERLGSHGYESVNEARGAMSAGNVPDPEAFERAWYRHALTSY